LQYSGAVGLAFTPDSKTPAVGWYGVRVLQLDAANGKKNAIL